MKQDIMKAPTGYKFVVVDDTTVRLEKVEKPVQTITSGFDLGNFNMWCRREIFIDRKYAYSQFLTEQ